MVTADPFEPNPWLMGVLLIGAGVVMWWLTPDAVRYQEEVNRSAWGSRSWFRGRPEEARSFLTVAGRFNAALLIVFGVAVLIVTANGP